MSNSKPIKHKGLQGLVFESLYKDIPCVVKKFFKNSLNGLSGKKHYEIEKSLLSAMSETVCVKLYGYDDDKLELYMEKAMDDLYEYSQSNIIKITDVIKIGFELINHIKTIHSADFVHRDIKPDNILILSTEPMRIRVADFGLACLKGVPEIPCGTVGYASAEINSPKHCYDGTEDYYSAAIVIAELLDHSDSKKKYLDIYRILSNGLCVYECLTFITLTLNSTEDEYPDILSFFNCERANVIIKKY